MKSFNSSNKNTGEAGIAYRACVWILSIMLVVTGMAPSFASNAKAGNGEVSGATKVATKTTGASKASEKDIAKKDADFKNKSADSKVKSVNSKEKANTFRPRIITKKQVIALKKQATASAQNAVYSFYSSYYKNLRRSSSNSQNPKSKINSNTSLKSKVASSIQQRARSLKLQKIKEGKRVSKDGEGKKDKFNKRGDRTFDLNSSGNVKAEVDDEGNGTITIGVLNSADDRNIEREKWIAMVKALGGENLNWKQSSFKGNIHVASEVYLPEDSSNMFRWFQGNVIGADKLNTSKVNNMNYMFADAPLVNPDVSNWDISKVKHVSCLFAFARSANPDVSKWNVSNLTSTQMIFQGATSANPDVSDWNVSNVVNMWGMFENATSANPDVSKWKVSKVTLFWSMFQGATSAKPDVSKWDVSSATNMQKMFEGATSANPDVSKWKTSNVTTMRMMFKGASSANPDVSNWDVSKVNDMTEMFVGSGIGEVDLRRWDMRSAPGCYNMFLRCNNLEFIKTPRGFKTNSVQAWRVHSHFKVVRLKKGKEAEVEHESADLNIGLGGLDINSSGDKDTAYNIYRKYKYAGVTFDKNNADTSAFRNHEIVEKGKSIKDAKVELPKELPEMEKHKCFGWAKSKTAAVPDFDENTIVSSDTNVYAVMRKNLFSLNSADNVRTKVGNDGNMTISVEDLTDDRNIERDKWIDMVKELGGAENLDWENSIFTGNIKVDNEVYLPELCTYMFLRFKGNLIGADKLNTSKVTDMRSMFMGAKSVNPDVSNWDMSKVTRIWSMFDGAESANPDVSKWNTSKVVDMDEVFKGARSANPDVSNWDVSKARDMSGLFKGSAVKTVNLSKWEVDTSVTADKNKTKDMFESCANLEYLKTPEGLKTNVSGADGDFKIVRLKKGSAAVTEENGKNLNDKYEINKAGGYAIYHIYKKDKYAGVVFDKNGGDEEGWINHEIAYKGKTIKASNGSLPMKNPTKEDSKFLGWATGKNADKSDFDENTTVSSDITVYSAWKGFEFSLNSAGNVKAKIGIDGNMTISAVDPVGDKNIEREKWMDMVKDTGGKNLNWGSSSFTGNIIVNDEVYLPKDSSLMFNYFKGNLIGAEKLNTSKVTNMRSMFGGATSVNPDVSKWDTSKVVNMSAMFQGATSADPDVSKWDTANVTNMSYMMAGTVSANPNVSDWNTSKVVTMFGMFENAKAVNPDVSKWKTSSATNMSAVFKGATSANPDVSNWDTSKVTLMSYMFYKATSASPDVSKWNTSNATKMYAMFKESGIKEADLSKWDISKVTSTGNMFDKCANLEYIKTPKGLKTTVSDADKDFKVVKLKTGSEATVEHESINLNSSFTVNGNGDKDTAYNIYRKDTHVGITFDKNGGDTSAFRNHEIAGKGKSIKDSKGSLPEIEPQRIGYRFTGWAKSKTAAVPGYDSGSPVYSDKTVYAVYEDMNEVTKVTIKYTDVGMDEDEVIEDVPVGKPIGSKLDGHERYREGYRFLGYSKMQNADKPDFFKKSIVTNNLVLYPVYKEIGTVDKVKVAFKLNDGTDASIKSEEVIRYESLGDKMPTKDSVPERDGYLFTGWAKSKAAKYPDFFRGTTVKGDMTVYAIWKSLYDEKLGQAVLKVAAKAKGYELTIEPPKANLHTGFDIFRSEKKDFKPDKDNKIATVDRNTLKFLDDKADNGKAYYYAVRAIDEDGSYNGTKVTFIGKLSDKVLAAPLPKDKGVTATVAGKGAVSLEFNKTIAAAKYKVTVTAPYDKKFKTIERFVEAGKLAAAGADKVKTSVTGLPMGKFLAFKLEALEADNNKLVEYGNSFAFMLGAVEKLSAKVNKKSRVLNIKFKAMKGVNGYEAKIVIGGKVKTIKLKKGKKKLRGFIVGSIKLPKKKGNYTFTIRAFKKIGKLKYFGQTITKVVK